MTIYCALLRTIAQSVGVRSMTTPTATRKGRSPAIRHARNLGESWRGELGTLAVAQTFSARTRHAKSWSCWSGQRSANRSDGSQSGDQCHSGGALVMTEQELQDELQRLRDAIALLANACGAHIVGQHTGRQLTDLLTPPDERRRPVRRPSATLAGLRP